MYKIEGIGLSDVQNVYSGPERELWELLMGEQMHIGGILSSKQLAQKAQIKPGSKGADFCCYTGAGMIYLIREHGVDEMTGVDATEKVVHIGKEKVKDGNLSSKVKFICADVCQTPLESESLDFVWGEDAWCYVVDKEKMIKEAVRVVKPGGKIAFTDWIAGETPMSKDEIERFLKFMKFNNIEMLDGYRKVLEENGCVVTTAENTGRFVPYMKLYLDILQLQHTFDFLQIIDHDSGIMSSILNELKFIQSLAIEGKLRQGLFIAKRKK